jgi:uncharacterized oxidoreductase
MRKFSPDSLERFGITIFTTLGCTEATARAVSEHLVESCLFGQEGHGLIRFYEYAKQTWEGNFDPKCEPVVIKDRACTALVDGGGGFGQVGAQLAISLAIDKAREHGMGAVGLRNVGHVGRAGAYPLSAARQGLIGMAFVNAGHLGRQIAPFGGIDGKLSTNPIAFAAPRRNGEPILLDITTSVVAEGKIRLAHHRGDKVPEGWIIDSEGNPTTNPADQLGDPPGAILPLGGAVGYKGYGMGMMVELMGGLLSGEGCASGERVFKSNGVFFTVCDPSFFTDEETYDREIESLISHVMSSRVDPKIGEILLPGELEFRTEKKRREEGIPVDDATWDLLVEVAQKLGIDHDAWDREAL